MKKLISNNGGWKTYAEIRECVTPPDLVQLRVLTQWEQGKNPDDLRVVCDIFLNPTERQALKDFL